jgi:hypothetical protein
MSVLFSEEVIDWKCRFLLFLRQIVHETMGFDFGCPHAQKFDIKKKGHWCGECGIVKELIEFIGIPSDLCAIRIWDPVGVQYQHTRGLKEGTFIDLTVDSMNKFRLLDRFIYRPLEYIAVEFLHRDISFVFDCGFKPSSKYTIMRTTDQTSWGIRGGPIALLYSTGGNEIIIQMGEKQSDLNGCCIAVQILDSFFDLTKDAPSPFQPTNKPPINIPNNVNNVNFLEML